MQSTLGNILGGIAANVGPEAAAKAQLLYQQTQGADIANETAYTQQQLMKRAAQTAPGLASTFGANAGVPGVVASVAQPPDDTMTPGPGGRYSLVNPSGFTPFQSYLANEIAAGRMSPDALTTAVTKLGQPAVSGPGSDYATQTEIAKARAMPYDLTAGTERHIPGGPVPTGQAGATTPGGGTAGPGETVVSGPSSYGQSAATSSGAADPAQAKVDVTEGAAAAANLGKAQLALGLYDQYLAPNANPTGVLSDEALKKLSAVSGMNFTRLTPIADVKNQIKSMFAGMVVNLRDSQGQPMFRGGIDQIMSQFPDPEADSARFRSALEALQTSLSRQVEDSRVALEYLQHPSPQSFNIYLQKKGQNAAAEGNAYTAAGIKVGQDAAPPVAPGPPAAPAASADLPLVRSPAEADALPPGTKFRLPDGRTGITPARRVQ
jgi:hypothetical protein